MNWNNAKHNNRIVPRGHRMCKLWPSHIMIFAVPMAWMQPLSVSFLGFNPRFQNVVLEQSEFSFLVVSLWQRKILYLLSDFLAPTRPKARSHASLSQEQRMDLLYRAGQDWWLWLCIVFESENWIERLRAGFDCTSMQSLCLSKASSQPRAFRIGFVLSNRGISKSWFLLWVGVCVCVCAVQDFPFDGNEEVKAAVCHLQVNDKCSSIASQNLSRMGPWQLVDANWGKALLTKIGCKQVCLFVYWRNL